MPLWRVQVVPMLLPGRVTWIALGGSQMYLRANVVPDVAPPECDGTTNTVYYETTSCMLGTVLVSSWLFQQSNRSFDIFQETNLPPLSDASTTFRSVPLRPRVAWPRLRDDLAAGACLGKGLLWMGWD